VDVLIRAGQVKKLLIAHCDEFQILFFALVAIKLMDNDWM
jgi:hypothetical protein